MVGAAAPAGAASNPYSQSLLDMWGQNGTAFRGRDRRQHCVRRGFFATRSATRSRSPGGNLMAITMAANPASASLTGFRVDTNAAVRALSPTGPISTWAATSRTSNRLARINLATSAVDASFSYNINNPVRDLLVVGNTLYLVGDFTSINGTTRRRAAAIDLTTRADRLQPQPERKDARRRLQRGDQPGAGRRHHHGQGHGSQLPGRGQPDQRRASSGGVQQPR